MKLKDENKDCLEEKETSSSYIHSLPEQQIRGSGAGNKRESAWIPNRAQDAVSKESY